MTLATRAKKARRTKGRCPSCRAALVTGQPIALIPGTGWTHIRCAIKNPGSAEPNQEGDHMAAGDTQITIVGNLVDDPELRFTPSGQAVAKFRIASTPRFFDKQAQEYKDGEGLFLTCNVWRQAAENCAESLTRGMRVIVQGRLKQRSYETREGEKRTVYEVEADEVGPSLKNATAKVAKTQRQGAGGQGQQAGGSRRDGIGPADDPWATGSAPTTGGFSDDPPF
jgi:single-strand DNA-binding protein